MLKPVLPRGCTQAIIGLIAVLLLCLSGTTVLAAISSQWPSQTVFAGPSLVSPPPPVLLAIEADIGSPFDDAPSVPRGQAANSETVAHGSAVRRRGSPSQGHGSQERGSQISHIEIFQHSPGGPSIGIRPGRTALWGAVNVVGAVAAYRQSQASWGRSRGKFHFKDDLTGDGMALSDEVSHLFAAYRLTQILDAGYGWIGAEKLRARRLAAVQAWLWMFAVEFPIDAFNPGQGFGVSDLVFNTAGVLMAHHRSGGEQPRWDVKISVKPQFFNGSARVIAYTNKQYDDYIYWLTYRPFRNRYVPLLVGAGYSTTHIAGGPVSKDIHLGVGTSLDELGGIFGESVGRYFKPLNFLFVNLHTKISWK